LSITFTSLSEANSAHVREFLVMSWKRDWSDELAESYFAWRYVARGASETLVACNQGRCVGILDSFIRPYWIAGRQEFVRETCDWFCMPEYRSAGVGLHLMRRMMAKPQPILVIGGSADTRNLLPRLKWAKLSDLSSFILVVSARALAGLVARNRPRGVTRVAHLIPDLPLIRRLPDVAAPSTNSRVRVRGHGEAGETPKIAPYVLAPLLDTKVVDWLARAPAVLGQFLVLDFLCGDELVGISISRLEKLPSFGWVAHLIHVHAARFELIDWMVGATTRHLVERGAGVVRCRASCPTTARALSALGFWQVKRVPAYWWPPNKLAHAGLHHLTALRGDDAFAFY